MRRSIATVSLSGGLAEKLTAIAAAKFDLVEIFENDLLFFDGSPREVRTIAEDLGLGVSLFQPFRDFEGVPDELFQRNLQRAERKFDVMAELGAPMMLVCSNVSPATLPDEERMAAQLHELARRAAARGLRIGYEALAWGARAKTYGDAWRIVQRADHSHLGVVLDSFHTLALNDDPAGIAHIPADKLFFLQLADAPQLEMDVLSWSRHFRCFPGQGGFDVAGFTQAAIEAGYTGPLSLEIFNDEFRASPTRQTARDGMRSLLLLEEQLRARLGEARSQARSDTPARPKVELIDPPPPPELAGVAFVEFAVDAASQAELAAWLSALGFGLAGRHRSKAVTLWREGEVLIALNAEPDSFAHSYYLMHGLSVCALGLRVADPSALLSRADVYGCRRFEERVGPNEHAMPAVRSPDGGLIYLVDEAFEALGDFVMEPGPIGAGGGAVVRSVDHIAQAVAPGQFDSWLLFLRVLLDLAPQDSWVLPDPYGLVRSRALVNNSRSVRLPLTFSESSRTAVARSLSSFAGAGVNQIAFATDDIFAAASMLQENEAVLLRIPDNYYEDLGARSGLADDLVDRLRENNILYDRDPDGGEFFHVYTETFQDRFFFEVVQRVGGYDQYGAANAPVRMAAQARRRRPAALAD